MYQNKENSYTDARITTTLLEFVSAKTDSHAAVIVSDQHKTYYAQLSLLTVHYHLSNVKHVNRALNTGTGTLRHNSSRSSLTCTSMTSFQTGGITDVTPMSLYIIIIISSYMSCIWSWTTTSLTRTVFRHPRDTCLRKYFGMCCKIGVGAC